MEPRVKEALEWNHPDHNEMECSKLDQFQKVLASEVRRLLALCEAHVEALNTPEILDFREAVVREAAHQRERWGPGHDAKKTPEDWLWVVAYLATKATQAARYGDREKYLHHIVTTAAVCANWHRAALSAAAQDEKPSVRETAKRLGIEPKEPKDAQAVIDRMTGVRSAKPCAECGGKGLIDNRFCTLPGCSGCVAPCPECSQKQSEEGR